MTKRKTDIIAPKYFTGLHAHSTVGSIGDATGNPKEHIDFAIENEMDSLALTDHGNMNGFSHQYLHAEELKKKGVSFKALFGVESYFLPSLKGWQALYESEAIRKKNEKQAASNTKKKSKKSDSSNSYSSTENEAEEIGDSIKEKVDEDIEGTSTIEDEEESKSNKVKNPLYQRSHLVLLAKNDAGLKGLFQLVSKSFKDGFYKYPRMDFDMLKEHANGNLIASSACIAGFLAKTVFDNQDKNNLPEKFINLEPNKYNFEKIQNELADTVTQFQDALGKENYYLELQFNSLNVQHLVNMHLIECAKRTGAPLIVTCDSHYANPKHWKEREIYKLMAQMKVMKKTPEELNAQIPQRIEDLKCELYPKNASQLWETYLDTTGQYDFYDDTQVRDAIQLTHSIAHDQIGNIQMDKKVKLPSIKRIIEKTKLEALIEEINDPALSVDEDYIAFQQLKKDAIKGAIWRKIQDKSEYIERLKEELSVVKKLKFSKYFLTYAKIMDLVSKEMLLGAGRGSASGSLLAYVLNITQIDPIKNGLLFERFLTRTKKCLDPNIWVKTIIDNKQIKNITTDDMVLTHNDEYKKVRYKESTFHTEKIKFELEDGTILISSTNHKWMVVRNEETIEIVASLINGTDKFISSLKALQQIKNIFTSKENNVELIDIGVEGDHTFYVSDKKDGSFYLTHNSFPDVDCLHENILVKKEDNSFVEIKDLKIGDYILDHNNIKREILFIDNRKSNKDDLLYNVFLQNSDGTYGSLVTTGKHRLLDLKQNEIEVKNIKCGDYIHTLYGYVKVINKELIEEVVGLVDITVKDTKTFQFIPFNVAKIEHNDGEFLVSVNNYSVDADLYLMYFGDYYYGKTKNNSGIIKL